jgi:hypothetical protein
MDGFGNNTSRGEEEKKVRHFIHGFISAFCVQFNRKGENWAEET